MKTFIVRSTATIVRETAVQANSKDEAKSLVKSGSAVAVDLSKKYSNTVNSVSERK
jgi:hypothetical protein